MDIHTSHPAVLKRLKRCHGHLSKVIEMVESGEPCLSVAQQLQAVVSALNAAKSIHVHDHIEHCLAETLDRVPREMHQQLAEFREIAKFL